jgi:hypothetical protein
MFCWMLLRVVTLDMAVVAITARSREVQDLYVINGNSLRFEAVLSIHAVDMVDWTAQITKIAREVILNMHYRLRSCC